MRAGTRIMALVAVGAAWTMAGAATVMAAPPGNDTSGGAVVVDPGSLPFAAAVDTTEATTDADDAQANASCGAPATDASVWYQFTPTTSAVYVVDVSGSDYSAGAIIATGTPGNLITEACDPGVVGFFGSAGVTYWIIAFDDQFDGGGNGGSLQFRLEQAPPPPELTVTVDPVGTFDAKTGNGSISGTVTCTGEADFVHLSVSVNQRAGRVIIRGGGGATLGGDACTGSPVAWSSFVQAENGLFKGGRATVQVDGFACKFDCAFSSFEASVRLRAG